MSLIIPNIIICTSYEMQCQELIIETVIGCSGDSCILVKLGTVRTRVELTLP